jgi:hypothetical protein
VGFLAVMSCSSFSWADNQVLNAGFESVDPSGKPSYWNLEEKIWMNGGQARSDSATAHSGKYSLLLDQTREIVPPADAPSEHLARYLIDKKLGGFVFVDQRLPVEAGKYYDFQFWYKASGLKLENKDKDGGTYAHFSVSIFWLDANDKSAPQDGSVWVFNCGANMPDWAQVANRRAVGNDNHRAYLAPPGAATADIRFSIVTVCSGHKPKVWIDDVEINEH